MDFIDFIRTKKYLRLKEAVEIFSSYCVQSKNWEPYEDISTAKKEINNRLRSLFIDGILKEKIRGKIEYSDEFYYDERTGECLNYIDTENSHIDALQLIKWAIKHHYISAQDMCENMNEQSNKNPTNELAKSNNKSDLADDRYPDYKELKFQDITKEKYEDLKRHYGMLRAEESKWRRAVSIATSIGILFFENGLKKPATKEAFKEAYKAEFDGIPMRLVENIYNALPDGYKSLAGESKEVESRPIDDDTLDTIIKTSVAAGLFRAEDEIKDAKDLERKLLRYEFEIPLDQYLKAISGACKRVYKQYQTRQA